MTETMIDKTANAIIAEYREIWPGNWPARPEAQRLAHAAINAARDPICAMAVEAYGLLDPEPEKRLRALIDAALQEGQDDG